VNRSHVEPAIELLSSTIDELHERLGDRELGQLYGQLARAQSLHEEPAAALAAADLGLAHAGRAHDAEVVADTLISKATALAGLGRVIEAVALLRGAIDLAERSGFDRIDLRARNNLAGFIAVDDPREGREMLRIGLERARRLGEAGWVAALTLINALGSFWLGEWDQVLADIEAAEEESGEVVRGGLLLVVRSWVQAARGDIEAAQASIAAASRQTEGQSSPTAHAYIHVYSPAWIALCEGRFDDAYAGGLTAARESWEVIEESSVVGGVAAALAANTDVLDEISTLLSNSGFAALHFEALQAELEAARLGLSGRIPEAGLAFSAAADIVRRLGYTVELALLTVARATLIRPPDAATTAAVAEARQILTRLGAAALLKLLDDAVAGSGSVPSRGAAAPASSSVQSPAST
jgi:hypothetical protein